jgi:uncharacterized membrane protein (DUF4010 family)
MVLLRSVSSLRSNSFLTLLIAAAACLAACGSEETGENGTADASVAEGSTHDAAADREAGITLAAVTNTLVKGGIATIAGGRALGGRVGASFGVVLACGGIAALLVKVLGG